MGIKYEITAVTGEYKNRDGETKKRYSKLGVVMETKNGLMVKVESIPIGWDGWAYLNEPREREEGATKSRGAPATGGMADMDSDVPF
jgi:hypothetical protein